MIRLLQWFENSALKKWKKEILFFIDVVILCFGCLLSQLLLSFTDAYQLTLEPSKHLFYFGTLLVTLSAFRCLLHLYRNIWRYPSTKVYLQLIFTDFLAGLLAWGISEIFRFSIGLAAAALTSLCVLFFTMLSRFAYRVLYNRQNLNHSGNQNRTSVAIVGAGEIGVLLAKELKHDTGAHYMPYCFIDSDSHKAGSRVMGLPVLQENDQVLARLKKLPVQTILIALPELDTDELQKIFLFYQQSGLPVKLYDFPLKESNETPKEGKRQIREFKIEDLLFRNCVNFANEESRRFCADKVVLVTGGGGSIGSELCRQIANCQPRQLIVLDIYENNAYDLQQELKWKHPDLNLAVEIASVRDEKRLQSIFDHYRPEIVFHAAAHKHVPLMEHSNCEAIKNNVFGTYHAANAAEKSGVKKFILVSTDKAVNPTNVMGASKRMCEMVIQCRTDSQTSFAAVRFGNVLGSNGSVIPLFKRQIANGGPVTVTDKRIIRYFMTIPEASQLVMQAGALAKSGELFVLNMGKPVEIYKLAENMIRLSGFTPGKEIEIVETGLRPGEKLYEELLMESETRTQTENKMIFIERDTPLSRAEVEEKLEILRHAVQAAEDQVGADSIRLALMQVVPTYHTPEEVNANSEEIRKKQMA